MSDKDSIEKLRKRMDGWGLNDDPAWLKVKLGELRALFRAYDKRAHPTPSKDTNE